MYCDEPIIAAYEGIQEDDYFKFSNAFLDCYHDMAYHVKKGYRIVLETEHFYISLSVSGVELLQKNCSIEELEENGEWLDPYMHPALDSDESPWVDYEATLFVGERLKEVKAVNDIFLLKFDHFQLKIVPHRSEVDDIPSLHSENPQAYHHVYGTEHLIKRKCSCGGTGELLLDFVSDYIVGCKECKKSTMASMNAIDAIEDWEAGEIHCEISDITIE